MFEVVPLPAFKDNYVWTLRDGRHPVVVDPVSGGDVVPLPELGATFSVLDIPGHIRAHVAYYGAGMEEPVLAG